MGTAVGTGIGLGVESAIERVFILVPTLPAHLEFFHRGIRAVVRERFDDCKARAAVRAVGERVEMPPIRRIKDFSPAVGACGDIRKDEGGCLPGTIAVANLEPGESNGVEEGEFKALDERTGRLLLFDTEK